MAGNAMGSLAGTLVADDGSCTAGSAAIYNSSGSVPQLAPSRPSSGLGGVTHILPLIYGRSDTGLTMDATGAAGLFHIVNVTGTSLVLLSEAANNNSKTDKVLWEFIVPAFYKSGDNITVTVNGLFTVGGGTATVKTVVAAAYLLANAGTSSANLVATSAATLTGSAADYTFTITGTTLTPNARILVEVITVLTETASSNITATINSVRLS